MRSLGPAYSRLRSLHDEPWLSIVRLTSPALRRPTPANALCRLDRSVQRYEVSPLRLCQSLYLGSWSAPTRQCASTTRRLGHFGACTSPHCPIESETIAEAHGRRLEP